MPEKRSGAGIFRQLTQRAGLILITLATVAGCAHGKMRNGVFYAEKDSYRITTPGEPWKRVSIKGVDLVVAYEDHGASILTSTLCGRYTQAGLDILSRNLFIGIGKRTVIEEESVKLPAGKAERRRIDARLDGAELRAEAYTLRRNPCVYDFVYMSIPDHFDEHLPAFRVMMDSLRFGTGGGE